MSLLTSIRNYFSGASNNADTVYPAPLDPPKYNHSLTSTTSTLTLPTGRKIAYAQYGAPHGKAIFSLHGLPGSRIECARIHDLASEMGARIIGIDRPGFGGSTPQEGRSLIDHAKDVEAVADAEGVKEFGVIGVSGGGPYVLACAAHLPSHRLKSASMVCGVGPPDIGWADAGIHTRLGFTYCYLWTPRLTQWALSRQPQGRIDLSDEQRLAMMRKQGWGNTSTLHTKDAEGLKDTEMLRLLLVSTREANKQGASGQYAVQDGQIMCRDWGFKVEDIRKDLPVYLWYGKHDEAVPLSHGQGVAKKLGANATLHVTDDTHASIGTNIRREILEELLRHL